MPYGFMTKHNVSMLARLFRCLRVDAIVEPMRIFADLDGSGNSQRPDILL